VKSNYLTKNRSNPRIEIESVEGGPSKRKPTNLSIAIPDDSKNEELVKDEESDFKHGEENLAPSSEKKRADKVLNGDKIPKTGGMKTGTHLGQNQSSKNIFLNKF
jgi:hypothetical protein